jgi:hypothetical protein
MRFALSTPAYVIFAALLVFGMAVVLQFTFRLVRDAKRVATSARDARERLQESAARLQEESRKASEHASAMSKSTRRRRR